MSSYYYYHGKAESARDLTVVVIPLLDLWLASSEVGADKADAGGVEQEADGNTTFIACGSAHSSLYSVYGHIPGTQITCIITPVITV